MNNDPILGTPEFDLLEGTDGPDTLFGLGGFDVLYGYGGDDVLDGGDDDDFLDGGTGADIMSGGGGSDTYIVDDEGDFVIELPGGSDEWNVLIASVSVTVPDNVQQVQLTGTDNLRVIGNNLDNYIIGNIGNNSLFGADGLDQIYGGDGDDQLSGGGDDDHLEGDAGRDSADGDEGNDTLYGGAGEDSLSGGDGDDQLFGGDDNDDLDGGAGNDYLAGGNGADALNGGAGSDYLDGGLGADTLDGGDGDDNYRIDNEDDVILDSGGIDTVWASFSYTLADGMENLSLLGHGGQVLEGHGNAGDNYLIAHTSGGVGSRLFGESGNDTLSAGNGDDYLDGGSGNDVLSQFYGADTLVGGSGDDWYYCNDETYGSIVEDADGGYDTAVVWNAKADFSLDRHVEYWILRGAVYIRVDGSEDGEEILAIFNNGAAIHGNGGDDLLRSGHYGDLYGGTGNDTLVGTNSVANILDGGEGDDRIEIDHSDDVVTGGSGNDTFVFAGRWDADAVYHVSDFEADGDKIELSAGSYSQQVGALDAALFYAGTDAASQRGFSFAFDTDTGALYHHGQMMAVINVVSGSIGADDFVFA